MPKLKDNGNSTTQPNIVSHSITDEDRGDLTALLTMRFGQVPQKVLAEIRNLGDFSQVDRLIIVAANAATFDDFVRELHRPGFRIVGQDFDPLAKVNEILPEESKEK